MFDMFDSRCAIIAHLVARVCRDPLAVAILGKGLCLVTTWQEVPDYKGIADGIKCIPARICGQEPWCKQLIDRISSLVCG